MINLVKSFGVVPVIAVCVIFVKKVFLNVVKVIVTVIAGLSSSDLI